jgi:hypothetical protein
MDLDISSLWSWTVPLWGLFVIVMYLGGILSESQVIVGGPIVSQSGGAHAQRAVRRK